MKMVVHDPPRVDLPKYFYDVEIVVEDKNFSFGIEKCKELNERHTGWRGKNEPTENLVVGALEMLDKMIKLNDNNRYAFVGALCGIAPAKVETIINDFFHELQKMSEQGHGYFK